MTYKRTCKICGQEFESKTPQNHVCYKPHYRTCEICGRSFEVPRNRIFDESLTTCSKPCTNIKRNQAIKKALSSKPKGYNSPKTIYTKICKYCGKRFTTNQYNREYCDDDHYKICEVCGNEFQISITQIFNNVKTCSSECAKQLADATNLIKYGDACYTKTVEGSNRLRSTSAAAKIKREATNLARYGQKYYSSTISHLETIMSDKTKSENLNLFLIDPTGYIQSNFSTKPTVKQLSQSIGINTTSTIVRIHQFHIEQYVEFKYSYMENDVYDVIKGIDPNIEIIRNDRKQINPFELDLYLPDFNLAIECNPTATHNSSINVFDPLSLPLSPSYHKKKTDMCDKSGIFLFHIYGYEWEHKRDIIISMLKNLLGRNESKIGARKCVIKDVDSKSARAFLNNNHRQGYAPADLSLIHI